MRELKTTFWRKAAAQLPSAYRARYAGYFAQAERFEGLLDALSGLFARKKTYPARMRSA